MNPKMQFGLKPSALEISAAVEDLGICKYFPAGDGERKAMMRLIRAMVSTKPQLDWLVSTMVNQVGEWRGPKEFRGLFCTRFKPADGIEADCLETPGFTGAALEARSIETHEERKALTGGRDQKLIAGAPGAIPEVEKLYLVVPLSDRHVKTTSVRRKAAPEDVTRVEEMLRSLEGE